MNKKLIAARLQKGREALNSPGKEFNSCGATKEKVLLLLVISLIRDETHRRFLSEDLTNQGYTGIYRADSYLGPLKSALKDKISILN